MIMSLLLYYSGNGDTVYIIWLVREYQTILYIPHNYYVRLFI